MVNGLPCSLDEYAAVHDVLDGVLYGGLETTPAPTPRFQVDFSYKYKRIAL